jgi:hypothetical protein
MIAELIIGPVKGDKSGSGGAKDGSGWDVEGWVRWLEGLRGQYESRMNEMCDILDAGKTLVKSGRRHSLSEVTSQLVLDNQETPGGDEWSVIETAKMYDFVRPLGGMFIWVRFNFPTHPLAQKVALPRLAQALWILWTKVPYRVLVSPGTIFAPTEEIRERDAWECFRLCFAAVPREELKSISDRFVEGVRAFWRIKDSKKIDELLKDFEMAGEQTGGGMAMLTGMC